MLCQCYDDALRARSNIEEFIGLLQEAEPSVLKSIVSTGEMLGNQIDFSLLIISRVIIDLPVHVSSWETINEMLQELSKFLSAVKNPPR